MMLQLLKQARAAIGLLNPREVMERATRPVQIGLVATTDAGYAAMEDFLVPATAPIDERPYLLDRVHRASDAGVPDSVDLILFEEGLDHPKGTYTFYRGNPSATAAEIVRSNDDLALALGRQYPGFRQAAVDHTVQTVSRENALFAVATALPDIVPSLIELPWAVGEWASDTAFLTGNQIRMAFLIAAACGQQPGLAEQKAAVISITAGAFGWRAIARELAGKIPLGGGLIPKGAIAYAGTFVVGKGLQRFYQGAPSYTAAQRRAVYRQALEHGRSVAEDAAKTVVS